MTAAADTVSGQLQGFLERTPYVRFLGFKAELAGDALTGVLPFSEHLVGNTFIPALHGGVIGAFLEMTALAQLFIVQPPGPRPKTIDVTIEYLTPGRAQTSYARAEVRKIGRRIANVHVDAWQEDPSQPFAALRGHFLLRSEEA
ncbi:MAG: PaaI family thioesterase [Caulobacteraceae bacterium]